MASVPIGGVRVDLTLNSAAFIKDIAKTNAAIATSTKQMTSQLQRLQQVSQSVGKTFGAWITLRATRQVISFLDRSIELAAKLDNQLGQTAKAFETQGAAMRNALQLGAAQGFLNVFTSGTQTAIQRLEQMAKFGAIIGTVFGALATVTVDVFTIVIPRAIQFSIRQVNNLINAANAAVTMGEKIDNALGLNKKYGRIPIIPITDLEAGAAALFGVDEAARLAANAAALAAAGQEKLGKSVKDTTGKIIGQLNAMDALRQKQFEASIETTKNWLTVADTVGNALGIMFKENKAVAIVQAVINTAQAITEALKLPFPLNWAQAAAVTAVGAAQIATIASAQPGTSKALAKSSGAGKGGSGGGASGGGSAPARAGAASTAAVAAGVSSSLNITLVGESGFSREQIRDLIGHINSAVGDGAQLNVSTR